MEKRIKGILEVLFVVMIFLFTSYIIQANIEFLEGFVTNDAVGMFFYILIEISSIVIAPVSTLPLVIVASKLWGWIMTGILNVVGWTIGSWIAFIIARKYGVNIVKRFISIEKVHEIENKVPKKHLFWSVVLMRIAIPVDALSYALGIFTQMSTKSYLLATLIGMIPFAFAWAYFGTMNFYYQIILFLIAGILILVGWITKLTCERCVEFVKRKRR